MTTSLKDVNVEMLEKYVPTIALTTGIALLRSKSTKLERDMKILTAAYTTLDIIGEKLRYEILEDHLDLNF